MWDLERANHVFDAINHVKRNAEADSPEDFDFFLTAGDNIYPFVANKPMSFEFGRMMNLFNRDAIKDLPIYPIRGNHDCLFADGDAELDLAKKYPNWKFDEYYYQTEFEVSPEGEKMALMHVDSCYLLCATYGSGKGQYHKDDLDDHTKAVYQSKCEGDETYEKLGNKMLKEMRKAMKKQDKDDKLIWKGSVMHHMMFGLHYTDYGAIIDEFLPLMKKHNYDLFFNGHEHQMNYAYTPTDIDLEYHKFQPEVYETVETQCYDTVEVFP